MKTLSQNVQKLVQILSDGDYHTGSNLGNALGISRSAVWKIIGQLQDFGIPIDKHKAKGYRLPHRLSLLSEATIRQQLSEFLNHQFEFTLYSITDSTNARLKATSCAPNDKVDVLLAEQQTQGRGRFNRHWHSPFGSNIYLSSRWTFAKDVSQLSGLSLIVSLAIAKALKNYCAQDFKIKWPNDILHQGQKLAGALIEITAESNGLATLIIGIGLNANMTECPHDMGQDWTSLQRITKTYHDRNQIIAQILEQLYHYLQTFTHNSFENYIKEWQSFDYLYGQKICLHHHQNTYQGVAKGINQHGNLLIELPNGNIKAFSSGDTTLHQSLATAN